MILGRVRVAFAVAMTAVLGYVVAQEWEEIFATAESLGLELAAVVGMVLVALAFGGRTWSLLVDIGYVKGVHALAASLPARYLPMGSLVQLMGQSGHAVETGAEPRRAVAAAPVFLVVMAVGAIGVALPLVVWESLPRWLFVFLVVGAIVASAILLTRAAIIDWAGVTPSGIRAVITDLGTVPVWPALLWGAASVAANGTGWWLLVSSHQGAEAISVFAVSWLVGFVFVIAPAGIGVREGVLVALTPGPSASLVVAASLGFRVASLVAEAILFVVMSLIVARKRQQ